MCCILIKNLYVIIITKVIFICLLSFIPWPPIPMTIQCSRELSRTVRKIVQSKMTPIFSKYDVEMPLECPFHPKRDLFYPQEEAKIRYRPTQFTCGLCGKSFYEEKYLDLHFDNRHRTNVNHAEDAICLADYCDLLRCDVLVMKDSSSSLDSGSTNIPVSTDIELYNEATALAAARREVVKSHMSTNSFNIPPSLKEKLNDLLAATGHKIEIPTPKEKIHKRRRNICNEQSKKSSNDSNDEKEGSSNSSCESPGDVRYNRFSEIQRLKAGCKHEDIHKLKNRCERLIRTCISNALTKLSIEDFKNMENEMNKAICWYLTCDRYWEDSSVHRPFPFALVFILVIVLSLGICLCYYIIWILFDTDENFSSSYNNLLTAPSSYHQPLQTSAIGSIQNSGLISTSLSLPHGMNSNIYHGAGSSGMAQSLSTQPLEHMSNYHHNNDELYHSTAGIEEQYIYVSYPGEMKKRLNDSFYNRTSRI